MLTILAQKARKYRHWRRLRRPSDALPDQYYFAYGANVLPERLKANHMRFAWIGKGCALDRRLVFGLRTFLRGMGYASLAAEPGATAWGVLYKLDEPSLALLDDLEWVRYGYYRRVRVPVKAEVDGQETTVQAWAYEALRHHADLIPSTEYLQGILKTGEALGYPRDYLDALAAQPHQPFASFPPNHAFRISRLDRERPLPGLLAPLYKSHDALRRQLMRRLP